MSLNMFGKTDPKDKEKEAMRREAYRRIERETYGLNISQLREWSKKRMKEELTTEMAKQQIAVAKVRDFLDTIATIVRLQSWWRMTKLRRIFYQVIEQRREVKKLYFRALKIYWQSEKMRYYHLFGKFFFAWKEESSDQKRLRKLIQTFFTNCIHRMRLSPQAVMAYFNPGEWSCNISESDNMKVRRLIIQRLFNGWRQESRELKTVRYKASQILSRMMRRTKGPMWVKESTLVSFHMWYRYVKVKRAYRNGEPDPRFNNPFLPQWAKLYKDLTVLRIKRKRSLETSQKLTQLRAFRNWKYLMTVDRTKPVTPLAVAINHYNSVLSTKILYAWFDLIRERGRNTRFRNKIFEVWKQWAPRSRYLREKNRDALEWLRLFRQRKAMDIMIAICRSVVGERTEKIKEMRRNFCDRKLVIAAYAFMNLDAHVTMVDCWRRYTYFWRCHRNWKALNAQFSYQWYIHKAKAIFSAWKGYTKTQRTNKMMKRVSELKEQDSKRMKGKLAEEEEDELEAILSPSKGITEDPNAAELVALMQQLHQTNTTGAVNTEHSGEESPSIYDNFLPVSDDLFQRARKGQLSTKLTPDQFFLFCFLYAQAYRRLPNHANFSVHGHHQHHQHQNQHPHGESFHSHPTHSEGYRPRSASAPSTANPAANSDEISAQPMQPVNPMPKALQATHHRIMPVSIDATEHAAKELVVNMLWRPEVQANLQTAVDEVHLQHSVSLLSQGAVFDPRLVSQLGQHTGDQYLSLFVIMMLGCVSFLAERVIRKDRQEVVNGLAHPIAALFAASQIRRWEQGKLTGRERSTLTQDLLVHDAIGGRFRSIFIWRNAMLLYLDIKAEDFARACSSLDEHRTVEQEVAEVMRRSKVERLIKLRHKLTLLLGHEAPWTVEERIKVVLPPLLVLNARRSTFFAPEMFNPAVNAVSPGGGPMKDIYSVLREYIFLTGRLAEEAREFRQPLLRRDKELSVRGFLKQARVELQALRRERMSVKDKEAENEKKQREEEKLRIKQEKEYAKIKKARKKKKAKLKKWRKKMSKKNKKNGGLSAEEMEEPDSAESETASMSSTFSSYDEHDLAGSEKFAVGDLIDGMMSGMLEEHEIAHEKLFLQRVTPVCHPYPVFTETWIPYYWKDDPQTSQTVENRMYFELKACLRRLLRVVSSDERYALLRGPSQLQQQPQLTLTDGTMDAVPERPLSSSLQHQPFHLKDEYNSIGMYLIDVTLKQYNQGVSSVWNPLPKDYWKFKNVRERVLRECAVMNAVVAGLSAQYRQQKHQNDHTDDSVEQYQKFLKKTRKQIVQIAEKQKGMYQEDELVKAAKVKTLKTAEGKLASVRAQIKSQKEKLRFVDMLFTQNNFEAIEEMLKPKEDPNAVQEAPKGGKKNAKKEEAARPNAESAQKYINELQEKTSQLEQSIPIVETKIIQAKQDLQEFETVRRRMGRLLKTLAEERFNFMVDVQELMIRTSKQLDKSEDEHDRLHKYRKFQMGYAKQLQYFFDDNITERGLQLTKEAEQRKYDELMSRPGSKQSRQPQEASDMHLFMSGLATPVMSGSRMQTPMAQGTGTNTNNNNTRKGGLMLGELDSWHEMSDSAISSPPFSPHQPVSGAGSAMSRLRSSVNLGAMLSPVASSRNLQRTYSSRDAATNEGIATWSSPSSPSHHHDHHMNFEHDLARDPEEHLAEMAAAFDDVLSPHHLQDAAIDYSDGMSPMRNTRRSVDEQIALMHFNSPEMVKKREEELRLLAEEQAKQAEIHELRMRTFDEYWLAYPRREMEFEASTSTDNIDEKEQPSGSVSHLSDIGSPKRHHRRRKSQSAEGEEGEAGDEGSVFSIMSTNATRMWKSIGQAYWRAKEEAVREMIQQRLDESGMNPENLDDIQFMVKDGVDPLDAELDFLQPDTGANASAIPEILTPSKLALADEFQHLPSDLWWKYSLIPTASQVVGDTAATPAGSQSQPPIDPQPSQPVDDSDSLSMDSTVTPNRRQHGQIKLSVSLREVVRDDASSKGPGSDFKGKKMSTATATFLLRRKQSTTAGQESGGSVTSNPDDAPDPFIVMGRATYKLNKETLAHRAKLAMELEDDDFSVDSRLQQLPSDVDGVDQAAVPASAVFAEGEEGGSIHFSTGVSSANSSVSTRKSYPIMSELPPADARIDQRDNAPNSFHRGPLFNDDDDTINSDEQKEDLRSVPIVESQPIVVTKSDSSSSIGGGVRILPKITDVDNENDEEERHQEAPPVMLHSGTSSVMSSVHSQLVAPNIEPMAPDNLAPSDTSVDVGDVGSLATSVATSLNDSQGNPLRKGANSKSSFVVPKAKRPAKSIRQSFASTTGTDVLMATQRFLNDPEVQEKLTKVRQPSVMRPPVASTLSNNMLRPVSSDMPSEDAGTNKKQGDEALPTTADDDRTVGTISPFDAIQAALDRVRADFGDTLDPTENLGSVVEESAFDDESVDHNMDEPGHEHHRKREDVHLTGSFSYTENTMSMVAKHQRESEKLRMMMQRGSHIDEHDEEHDHGAMHPNFDGSQLDMQSSGESLLFHMSFNDSVSNANSPAQRAQSIAQKKKKGPIIGSNIRRSMDMVASGPVEDNPSIVVSSTGLGGVVHPASVDKRPGSPSVHHPISLAEAQAIARTTGTLSNQDTVPAVPRDDHPHLHLDEDAPENKPLVEQLGLLMYEDQPVPASEARPKSSMASTLLAMTISEEELGFRPSTTSLQEIITGLKNGQKDDSEDPDDKNASTRFQYFPPEFRQNDPDFQQLEKLAKEEKLKKEKERKQAEKAKLKDSKGKNSPKKFPLVAAIPEDAEVSSSSHKQEDNKKSTTEDSGDEGEDKDDATGLKKRVKIVSRHDPGHKRHFDANATVYPDAKDDDNDTVFRSPAARRLLAPTLINAQPPRKNDQLQTSTSPARKPYVEPNYSASPGKAKKEKKDDAPKSAVEEVLLAGIVKPYEKKQLLKKKKLGGKRKEGEKGVESQTETEGDAGEEDDLELMNLKLDHELRKSIQSGQISSVNTIDTVTQELRKLIQSQEGLQNTTMATPSLSLMAVRSKLQTRDLHFHEITESKAQVTNFYQLPIPKPTSPDYQRHFVHPKSSDQVKRRPTTGDLNKRSPSPPPPAQHQSLDMMQGATVPNTDILPPPSSDSPYHNSPSGTSMSKDAQVIVESEFQRTGSPEFWIGVVAQRSRTNSFRSPLSPGKSNTNNNNAFLQPNRTNEDHPGYADDDEDLVPYDETQFVHSPEAARVNYHNRLLNPSQSLHSPMSSPYSPSTLRDDHAKNPLDMRVDIEYNVSKPLLLASETMPTEVNTVVPKPEPYIPAKFAISFPTKGHHFSSVASAQPQESNMDKKNKAQPKNKPSKKATSHMSASMSSSALPTTQPLELTVSQSTGALKMGHRASSPTLGLPKRSVLYHPKLLKQLEEEEKALSMPPPETTASNSVTVKPQRDGITTPMTSLDIIHAIAGDEYRVEVRPSARDAMTPVVAPVSSHALGNSLDASSHGSLVGTGVAGGPSLESSLSLLPTKPPPVSALPYDGTHPHSSATAASIASVLSTQYPPNTQRPLVGKEDMMVVSKAILPSRPTSLANPAHGASLKPTNTSTNNAPVVTLRMPSVQLGDRPIYDDEIPASPQNPQLTSKAPLGETVESSLSTWESVQGGASGEVKGGEKEEEEEEEMDLEEELEAEMRRLFQMGEEKHVAQGPHLTLHDVHFQAKTALFQNASSSTTMVMNDEGQLVPIDTLQGGPAGSHQLHISHNTHHTTTSPGKHGKHATVTMRRVGNLKLPQPVSHSKKRLLAQGGMLPPLSVSNAPQLQQATPNLHILSQPLSRPSSGQVQATTMGPGAAYSPQFIIRKKSFVDELGHQHVHVLPISHEPTTMGLNRGNSMGHMSKTVSVPSASSGGSALSQSFNPGQSMLQPGRAAAPIHAEDYWSDDASSVLSNISSTFNNNNNNNQSKKKRQTNGNKQQQKNAKSKHNNQEANVQVKQAPTGLLATVGGSASMWLPRASRSQESHLKPISGNEGEQGSLQGSVSQRQPSITSQLTMSSHGSHK